MEDYLIDRDTLEKFINELFQKKPAPAENAEELNRVKKEMVQSLDDRINKAMLNGLSDEQLEELERMLDSGEESPEAYDAFYKNAGVNLETVFSKEMKNFEKEYLGGENE